MSGQFSIDRKKEIKEFISKQLSEYIGQEKNNTSLLEISNKLDIIIKLLTTTPNGFNSISKEDLKEIKQNKKNINMDDQFIPEINISSDNIEANVNTHKTKIKLEKDTLKKMKDILG